MRMIRQMLYGFSIVLMLLIASCSESDMGSTTSANKMDSIRPYSPWVFRSVMDDRPRMITLALHDQLYASYSTQNGALYKTWKGNVLFEGAVYNSAHGPQPITVGDAYFINKHEQPWAVFKNGQEMPYSFQYRGHDYLDFDHVQMNYELLVDGTTIEISEQPDARINEDNRLVFERIFTTSNVPDGIEIKLKSNVNSILNESYFSTDGKLELISKSDRENDGVTIRELDALVLLNSNKTTKLSAMLTDKALITNPNNALISEEDLAGSIGKSLIGKNDCKSCHNTYVKTIGPSYTSIAKKYKTNDANALYLVGKVIQGGKGVWGEVPMTPHPELPREDAEEMVAYILSLDKEDGESEEEIVEITKESYYEAKEGDYTANIPGALVKVYNIPGAPQKLPDFSKLKPIMGGVLSNFDNLEGNDFKDLKDDFGLTGEGNLEIKETGEYTFRLWSDDGSRLYINNQLVVDHDGSHGTSFKENTIGLKEGYHDFRVEYFNGRGGRFFSLNWKPAGNEVYEVMPTEVISHHPNMHSEVGNLTLPMSVASKIPGDGMALEGVHPSFEISQIRPESFLPKVGGLDVMPDGKVILSTWDQEGAVYIVDYKKATSSEDIKYKKIAGGLAEPLGLKVVDGDIYIMQKQEITQLIDRNGDDIIDEYRMICNAWDVSANFHEFGFGLAEKDDYLYATLAIGIMPGGASAVNQPKDRGKAIKVHRKTGKIEFLAHGLRTPNGIGIGYNDEIFVADNQGDWLPASKILHITKDAFFNSRAIDFEGTANLPVKQPLVWLPQDEIGNSPSTPLALNVGQYQNQMIHGEVTHGGLKRVFVEEIEGELQGALFRFTQGFEAGVNRIVWADNKNLIVGGIGNPGNWQHSGRKWYGLQKFSYNGKETFEMLAVRAKSNGIEIEFTQALKPGDGWDISAYEIDQFYYKPTAEYGGPKMDLKKLRVKSATVSEDRTRVFLEVQGMKEKHVLHLKLKEYFVSNKNQELWSTDCWYTMNKIPVNVLGQAQKAPQKTPHNTLSSAEKAAGWKLLFNGKDTEGIRNYGKQTIGSSWKVKDGVLYLDSQKKDDGGWQAKDGGDILVSDIAYKDFEFDLEWKISNCGNSGIIYNVVESDDYQYVWQTGPEMQILDNSCHPDTKYVTHRAGDLYDMIETKYTTVKPAGEWNKIKIISKNGVIQHWQNGYKVVEYEIGTENWAEMIKYSKFRDMPGFGKSDNGYIALQDHGDPVYFRNIKIRAL